jgi:hypothetical protein
MGTNQEYKKNISGSMEVAMPDLVRDVVSLLAMGGFLACASMWISVL